MKSECERTLQTGRAFVALLGLITCVSVSGWAQTLEPVAPLEIVPEGEILNALNGAPAREGPPPTTPDGIPHQQYSQNGPMDLQAILLESLSQLPGLRIEPTPFSLGGSLGWRLNADFRLGPEDAFIQQTDEFGHLHRPTDGSAHMLLPLAASAVALKKGWGIIHPLTDTISGDDSDYVMIYSARDEDELKMFWTIAQISYYYARGVSMDPTPSTDITPATLGRVKNSRR